MFMFHSKATPVRAPEKKEVRATRLTVSRVVGCGHTAAYGKQSGRVNSLGLCHCG